MSCCIFNKCKITQSSTKDNLSSIVCLNKNINKEITQFNKNNKHNDKYISNPNIIYNNDECIICFNKFGPKDLIKLLYCKHIFHKKCLDKWFKKKAVCPICNTNGM